jgi:SAM-dependent methyltransferase
MENENDLEKIKNELCKIKNSKSFRMGNLFFRSIKFPKCITFPLNFLRILFSNDNKQKINKLEEIRNVSSYCQICGNRSEFADFGNPVRRATQCLHCGSLERHRFLYIVYQILFFGEKRKINLLHMAPEKCLYSTLIKRKNITYFAADIDPDSYSFVKCQKEDFMGMSYENETFDVVLSNQVMEHIEDDKKFLAEIRRVMKDDGIAIINLPYNPKAEKTYEDANIKNSLDRKAAFGQGDHVRLYGRDVFMRLEEAGFFVNQIKSNIFPSCFVDYCRLECGTELIMDPSGYFVLRKKLS